MAYAKVLCVLGAAAPTIGPAIANFCRDAHKIASECVPVSKSIRSDANMGDSRFDKLGPIQSMSGTLLNDDTRAISEPKCDHSAARETRDARAYANKRSFDEFLIPIRSVRCWKKPNSYFPANSPPILGPSVSERALYAEKAKMVAGFVHNFRSVSDARDYNAIKVPYEQNVCNRDPVLCVDSTRALKKSACSISAMTANFRHAMRDACETQMSLDVQNANNMLSILEQEIFEANALLRRAYGLSNG